MPKDEQGQTEGIVTVSRSWLESVLYLAMLSGRDGLTGLNNRDGAVLLYERMQKELDRKALIKTARIGVLAVDLSKLKTMNDESGFSVGSAALVRTGELLGGSSRDKEDIVARIGGDEFAVFAQGGLAAAQKIQDRFEAQMGTEKAGFTAVCDDGVERAFRLEAYYVAFEVLAQADASEVVNFTGSAMASKKRGEPIDEKLLVQRARERGLLD